MVHQFNFLLSLFFISVLFLSCDSKLIKPTQLQINSQRNGERRKLSTSATVLSNEIIAYNDGDNEEFYRFPPEDINTAQSEYMKNIVPYLSQAHPTTVGILFGLLIWRSLSVYDTITQYTTSNLTNAFMKHALCGLLITNVIGFLLNFFKPQMMKTILKSILAMNTIREGLEGLFNIYMILFGAYPGERDVYIGRLFMNGWWMLLCVGYSKARWMASYSATANNTPPLGTQQRRTRRITPGYPSEYRPSNGY